MPLSFEKMKMYLAAAEKGSIIAMEKLLAEYHDYATDIEDEHRLFTLAYKAMSLGSPEGYFQLAWCVYHGLNHKADPVSAMPLLRHAACLGHPAAQSMLGECYQEGMALTADPCSAFAWFREAAQNKWPDAFGHLGHCYQEGLGTIPDHALALDCYRKGVERKSKVAQCYLGIAYLEGKIINRDVNTGAVLLYQSARQGVPLAMYYLAHCYQNGIGRRKNRILAFEWFREGHEAGDTACSVQLAEIMWHGMGKIRRNRKLAIVILTVASDEGNEDAQKLLQDYQKRQRSGKSAKPVRQTQVPD